MVSIVAFISPSASKCFELEAPGAPRPDHGSHLFVPSTNTLGILQKPQVKGLAWWSSG